MAVSLPVLRRIAILTIAASAGVAVLGAGRLNLNSHFSAYFDRDYAPFVAHREISNLYSRHDAIVLVLEAAESFLDSRNYGLLEDLTSELAQLPFATSSVSISELGLVGEKLTEDGDYIPSVRQLRNDGRAIGLLLAEDLTLAVIVVQIELPDDHSRTVLETVAAIRGQVDAVIGDRPVSAHYTGTLALNEAYIKVVQHDVLRIVPLLLLVMTVLLSRLLRRRWTVFMLLPVGICAVGAAFGITGLFGAELASINAFAPIIIFSTSLAGCVHMALSYEHCRDSDLRPDQAAVRALDHNLLPMLLANGTTALGFLGLALSPSPPIRVVGYQVAAGIVVSFILCMTLLPTLQARFDPWKRSETPRASPLDKLAVFAIRRRTSLAGLFLLLSLPAVWLASRNVISDNVFEYFRNSDPFTQATQLVENQLSGVNEVLYSVETGKPFGFFDADAIEAVGRFATWLRRQPEVNRAISIADVDVFEDARRGRRLQQRLDFYRDRVDDADRHGSPLDMVVSHDYSSSLVATYLKQMDSAQLTDFDRKVHRWAVGNLDGYVVRSGGATLMFAKLGEQNIRSMLISLTVALFCAALILGAVFRSTRLACAGLVCNLLPILLVYSVWAVVSGRISIGAAVVMGMILGIILDDTIYVLAAYRRGLQTRRDEPVVFAMRQVGPALIATTITLVAGLSMGLGSDFGPIRTMSVLSVSILSAALIVDLLLLPALLPATRSAGVAA